MSTSSSVDRPARALASLALVLSLGTAVASAQLDEKAARKDLAGAIKAGGKLYASEVVESVVFFGLDLA